MQSPQGFAPGFNDGYNQVPVMVPPVQVSNLTSQIRQILILFRMAHRGITPRVDIPTELG